MELHDAIRSFLRRAWPSLVMAAVLLLTAVFLGWACYFRHDISFLAQRSPAQWIIYPSPALTSVHAGVPLDAVFRRSFSPGSVPAAAQLRVRAFRTCTIRLNGKLVPAKANADRWKEESCFDVAQFLRAGQNDLSVTVSNSLGPPALWLALSCPENLLLSDKSWEASLAGATWLPAALAVDPVPLSTVDRDGMAEQVIPCLGKVWPTWLMFAGASLALVLVCGRWLAGGTSSSPAGPEARSGQQGAPARPATHGEKGRRQGRNREEAEQRRRRGAARAAPVASAGRSFLQPPGPYGPWVALTRVLFALIAVFWVALFLHNSRYLPPGSGYDGPAHLAYINHFRSSWSVPLPGQAWQTHHPPLYHFLAGTLLVVVGYAADTANGILTIRLLNLVLALSNVFIILACLRLIFPERPRCWAFGLVIAGFLPTNVYLYRSSTEFVGEVWLGKLAKCVI